MSQALFDAAVLGVVEGLTEFIPVSSTGHLILAEKLLNREDDHAKLFDVVIQAGAILAVVWSMRRYLFSILLGLPSDPRARHITIATAIGFFPAAAVGAVCYHFIKEHLFSAAVVGGAMIAGGFVILAVERLKPPEKIDNLDKIDFRTALLIGIFQIASLIPGVSRSGASIIGALCLGVGRRTAAEFSFLLAIPTIFGAAVYDIWRNREFLSTVDVPVFAVGTLAAFVSALIVIRWFLSFISSHGLAPFAYYRIVAGIAVLLFLAF